MEISNAPPGQAELDFESQNWNKARATFMGRHKDTDQRRKFLQQQTTGSSVKEACLSLQNEADLKYAKGLGGILSKIDALMKVGDLAIKSAPESVGLAWMGIRLCLHSTQDDFATFQLFSQACSDIIGIMISCRVYGKMYGHPEGPSDFQELHSKVVDYIPNIYTEILDFSYAVRKHSDKNVVFRVGKGLFSSSKGAFQDQMTAIQQAESKMRDFAKIATDRLVVHYQKQGLQGQEVMSADISMMKEALDANLKANELFMKHIEHLEEERKDMRKRTPYERAKDEFEENRKTLNPAADQTDLLEENLARREENTCRWIFDLDEYRSWHDNASSSILWVNGGPGYGKSILMSTVIEALKAARTESLNYLVQYFFCRAGDDATQTTTRILQNVIYQLYAVSEPSPELLDKCNEVIKKATNKKETGVRDTKVKTYNFQMSFSGLVKALGQKIFLVVDALDECIDRKDKGLVRELLQLVKTSGIEVKILVCSRPEPDLGDVLSSSVSVKVEGHNEDDIRRNVEAELSKFPGWTSAEKKHACEVIVGKSSGQFRYVDIALKLLRKPLSRPFEKALANLPDGLYSSYTQSLEQTDADYLELLKTSLTWSLLAEGSVRVSEIIDAYSNTYSAEAGVDEAVEDVSGEAETDLHDSQVRIAGGNFLDVSSQTHVISLRHTSVRDFFLKPQEESIQTNGDVAHLCSNCHRQQNLTHSFFLSEKTGHFEIARILVQNINSRVFQRKYLPSIDEEEQVLQEAKTSQDQPNGIQEGDDALHPDDSEDDAATAPKGESVSGNEGSQVAATARDGREAPPMENEKPSSHNDREDRAGGIEKGPDTESASEEAKNVQNSDEADNDGFSDDEEYIEAEEITPSGDPSGAQTDGDNIRYELTHWTYHLKRAEEQFSRSEREASDEWAELWKSLTAFMCDNPAVFNAWQKLQWYLPDSPLYYEVNKRWTPLQVAAAYSLTALAEQLIENSADINAVGAEGSPPPLQLAAQTGNLDLMKILLDRGAKLNDYGNGPTPFHWAVYCSPTVETIKLFIDHGADFTKIDGYGLNVMHYFSFSGSGVEALRLLLSAGGDINMKDAEGETPLHKLVTRTDLPLELLKAYLAEHAEVNIEDKESQRPLFEVACAGNTDAARLLIEGGADIFDDDVRGMTALHAASMYGQLDMVKMLLEKGVILNQPDKGLRTPFFHALQGGHIETAQCLLEALSDQPGEEVNKRSRDGRTPFRKAAARGYLKIIEMLLEKIDAIEAISATDDKLKQNSLHTAAYNGHDQTVKVLLKAGGDLINATDNKGRTPLQLCGQGWVKNKADSAEATLLFLIESDEAAAARCTDLLFMAATKDNSAKVIERLTAAGADPNVEDEHGWTPLLLAQQNNQTAAIEALSKQGAVSRTKPTKWVSSLDTVSVSEDGVDVVMKGIVSWGASVVSNHPVPAGIERYYFEIEIISASVPTEFKNNDAVYTIGLTTLPAKLEKQFPGHPNPGARTWAWHGDDGCLFDNGYNPRAYGGGPYEVGSVIGCGVDFVDKTIFYTKNGEKLPTAFEGVGGRLFPVVGMLGKIVLKANFGTDKTKPFKWPAVSWMEGGEMDVNP